MRRRDSEETSEEDSEVRVPRVRGGNICSGLKDITNRSKSC